MELRTYGIRVTQVTTGRGTGCPMTLEQVIVDSGLPRHDAQALASHALGVSDEKVVKQVLKRGKIATEEEFYVVKELVSSFVDMEGEEDDDITEEQRTKLDTIMTNWELGK